MIMRKLAIITFLLIGTGLAQPKNEHYTQVDTAWLFGEDEMTHSDSLKKFFMLDTMPGMTNYGSHGKDVLKLTKSVFGTKVGKGGCTELCWMIQGKLGIREKNTISLSNEEMIDSLVVGDVIHSTPYMFFSPTGNPKDILIPKSSAYHDMLYVGRQDATHILVAEQGWSEGHIPVRVICLDTQNFFGKDKKKRYFTATLVR